jgi:hypothetical protein
MTMNGAAAPERSPPASPPPLVQTQAPPSPSPTQPLEWRFSQVFGERSAGEEVQDGTDRSLLLLPYPAPLCHSLLLPAGS